MPVRVCVDPARSPPRLSRPGGQEPFIYIRAGVTEVAEPARKTKRGAGEVPWDVELVFKLRKGRASTRLSDCARRQHREASPRRHLSATFGVCGHSRQRLGRHRLVTAAGVSRSRRVRGPGAGRSGRGKNRWLGGRGIQAPASGGWSCRNKVSPGLAR